MAGITATSSVQFSSVVLCYVYVDYVFRYVLVVILLDIFFSFYFFLIFILMTFVSIDLLCACKRMCSEFYVYAFLS